MVDKLMLLFNTVRFLKPIQIYYRIYYFIRKRFRIFLKFKYLDTKESTPVKLALQKSIFSHRSYFGNKKFIFLNIDHHFEKNINWDYGNYGKLWTYNLNYFDYLNQETSYDYTKIIENFIDSHEEITVGYEPFPLSLRGINWIKYLSYNNINNKKINDSLYAQYYRLKDNLEYHLLGNHLLENGFSLLFAAYYFQDERLYRQAKKILKDELVEQILDDGAHFELSPMYHQIMLFRLLDSINLIQNNHWKDDGLLDFLNKKSELMLGWLKNITYINGDIPLVNDSTTGIAPRSKELFKYAKSLNINWKVESLKDSGYRKIIKEKYESIIDVGRIGASYIPGHAHSDTFSFEVYRRNKPFIVDTGLSTYETNERRMIERSTASHNTVELNRLNQSQVWGGFRVANRANIIFFEEKEDFFEVAHDGYKKDNLIHKRKWSFKKNKITIVDQLNKNSNAVAYLHFHPSIDKMDIERSIIVDRKKVELIKYQYAEAFNRLSDAWVMEIRFTNTLKISIIIK